MDGILCLDKPDTMTSFACCAVLRRLVGEKKAGHTGTLDPMATGVLPVLFGRATRAIPFLPVQDKRYTATLTFGYRSDTLDIWGKVEATGAPVPSPRAVEAACPLSLGEVRQVPPMMSALKRDGVRVRSGPPRHRSGTGGKAGDGPPPGHSGIRPGERHPDTGLRLFQRDIHTGDL